MTDHPHAETLDDIRTDDRPGAAAADAIAAGAAALRALAQLRPHHPGVIHGDQIAVLTVPYAALVAAREALGDFDLGPWDPTAAREAIRADREDHINELSRGERREKYELRR